jgi:hypothetical protein
MFCFQCGYIGHNETTCKNQIPALEEGATNPRGPRLRSTSYGRRINEKRDPRFNSNPMKSMSGGNFSPIPKAMLEMLAKMTLEEEEAAATTNNKSSQDQQGKEHNNNDSKNKDKASTQTGLSTKNPPTTTHSKNQKWQACSTTPAKGNENSILELQRAWETFCNQSTQEAPTESSA